MGGKTGTAQLGTEPAPVARLDHRVRRASPGEPARVAVAVIVEGQPGASEQTGGRVAAPIAQAVMAKILADAVTAAPTRHRPVPYAESRMTVQEPLVYNGRYEVQRRIARGGMAEVFLARDLLLARPVAVKVLFPEFAGDPSFVARFRREAQAAANLNHPNIVGRLRLGPGGRDLLHRDGVRRRQEPVGDPPQRGPAAAGRGRRHRHRRRRRPRLRPPQRRRPPRREARQHHDHRGRAREGGRLRHRPGHRRRRRGEPHPDRLGHGHRHLLLARSRPRATTSTPAATSTRSGVVMYEMATGQPPFAGDSPVSIAYKHVQEQPAPPRRVNPAVPAAFEAITLKLLAKRPDDRYASADELRSDLRRFMRGQPVLADPAGGRARRRPRPTQPPPPGRARRPRPARPSPPPPAAPTGAPAGSSSSCSCCWPCSAACIVAFAYATDLLGKEDAVEVPNVVNDNAVAAIAELRKAGFVVDYSARETSDTVAEDIVIRQDPAAGTELSEGRPGRHRHQQRARPRPRRSRCPTSPGGPADERGRVPARPRLHEREHPATAGSPTTSRRGRCSAPTRPAATRRPPKPDTEHHPLRVPGQGPRDHDHHHDRAHHRPRPPPTDPTTTTTEPDGGGDGEG